MATKASPEAHDRLRGVLLGTAVGDALGLPAEGLSAKRIARRWQGEWKMRMCFGTGMISDDTEHTVMIARSLLKHPEDARSFQKAFAWKLRWWFIALPAGVGLGTAKACLKLWMGIPPNHSGVKSAGNGPAMRSAVIGAFFPDDEVIRREYVRLSTRLTHTDTRAETAAIAVAEAAAWAMRGDPSDGFITKLPTFDDGEEWSDICHAMSDAYSENRSVSDFAHAIGLSRGVTGYAFHTAPVALYAWLRHRSDFKTALIKALNCGGDTDTVGAIVGALAGTSAGASNIPKEWSDRILDWPLSVTYIQNLADQLYSSHDTEVAVRPISRFWSAAILRNILFLIIVLGHGFRRLLPPY